MSPHTPIPTHDAGFTDGAAGAGVVGFSGEAGFHAFHHDAEGVGGVGVAVVDGCLDGEAGAGFVGDAVVLQAVDSGGAVGGVEAHAGKGFFGGVDPDPDVLGAGDDAGVGKAGFLEILLDAFSAGRGGGGIVREKMGA